MSDKTPIELAQLLVKAQETATPLPASFRHDFVSEAEAYAVQAAVRDEKIRRGCRVVGKKIGLTSRAMQEQLKTTQPDFGNLFSDQLFLQGMPIPASKFIMPMVEGEIAFVMERDLRGPGVSPADVLSAARGVMACLEFVDFRWDTSQFDLLHSIADNAACGGFLLGSKIVPLSGLDLRYVAMFVEKNGQLVNSGAGVEVMGDPLNAVAWLANSLAEHGEGLKAGDVVLSGALTRAVPVRAGDSLRVSFSTLGDVGVCFS